MVLLWGVVVAVGAVQLSFCLTHGSSIKHSSPFSDELPSQEALEMRPPPLYDEPSRPIMEQADFYGERKPALKAKIPSYRQWPSAQLFPSKSLSSLLRPTFQHRLEPSEGLPRWKPIELLPDSFIGQEVEKPSLFATEEGPSPSEDSEESDDVVDNTGFARDSNGERLKPFLISKQSSRLLSLGRTRPSLTLSIDASLNAIRDAIFQEKMRKKMEMMRLRADRNKQIMQQIGRRKREVLTTAHLKS